MLASTVVEFDRSIDRINSGNVILFTILDDLCYLRCVHYEILLQCVLKVILSSGLRNFGVVSFFGMGTLCLAHYLSTVCHSNFS